MARGEIPGTIIGLKTALVYAKTAAYGHASAGKDLALTLNSSGNAILATAGSGIAGVFIELRKDKKASCLIGEVVIMRQNAVDACTVGSKVVGAGAGQIKNAGTDTDGAGFVLEVQSNTANGRVVVRLP